MPKSRSKSKSRSKKDRKSSGKRKSGRRNIVAAAIAILLVAGGGYAWWSSSENESAFLKLAATGRAAGARIQTVPSRGQGHLRPGQSYVYSDQFPTSGPHDPNSTDPGFYGQPQPPTRLVHALEHGHIVIYYNQPANEVLATLRAWAALYTGPWSGVVVTPKPGLGEKVMLTAWTKRLALEKFDTAAAAAFIDAFRGRGPENRVR